VGAVVYFLVLGAAMLIQDETFGGKLPSMKVAAQLALALIVSVGLIGFSMRKRSMNFRSLRNFLVGDAVGILLCLLMLWAFSTLYRAGALGTMGGSEWVAAVTGSALLVFACLGMFSLASVRLGANLIDPDAAEDMRERSRLVLVSFVWMAASGLLLIVLGLSGPGSLLSPMAALAGTLVLAAILVVLGIAAWRLTDELGRTLSHETGNMAFYLILVLGSGWTILAHLGFAAAPAPLDWVTMFTLLLFAASVIATGRRRLLTS
jgi:hypothetical protein